MRAARALAAREAREALPLGVACGVAFLASLVAGGFAGAGARGASGLGDFPVMVGWSRPALALATTLFGALAGAGALAEPARAALLEAQAGMTRARVVLASLAGRLLVALAGAALGSALAIVAARVPGGAVPPASLAAFAAAHALGLAAFAALGLLLAARWPHARVVAAGALSIAVGPLWDAITFAAAFQSGALASGTVPAWLLPMQAANPLVAVKGVMITVDAGFRDAVEAAVMRGPLPAFVNPWTFLALLVAWTLAGLVGGLAILRHREE